MEIGVIFLDYINVKNAITIFRNISLSAGNVEFWLATGARGTDYKTLLLG